MEFTEEGLLGKIFRPFVVGVAINKGFILDQVGETRNERGMQHVVRATLPTMLPVS